MGDLSRYFSMAEVTHSNTANDRGIKNIPTGRELENLKRLALALDVLREAIARPISISSGYRNPVVNKLVGGATRSTHMTGLAVDIRIADHDVKALLGAAIAAGFKGIGLGTTQSGVANFLHVDLRSVPAAWLYNGGRLGNWPRLLGVPDPIATIRSKLS